MPSGDSKLLAGQVLELAFPTFRPRISFTSERELTVEILSGDNAGLRDTVEYDVVEIRGGIVVVSWQEHIGSTIVHVLDLAANRAHTFVTPAKGGFLRLSGAIERRRRTRRSRRGEDTRA